MTTTFVFPLALPRPQQHGEGLIHHRLVIDGQKRLADELGNGVEDCGGGGGVEGVHVLSGVDVTMW